MKEFIQKKYLNLSKNDLFFYNFEELILSN